MKTIKLTDLQQHRLVEMANELYPGRDWYWYLEMQEAGFYVICYQPYVKNRIQYGGVDIHWLEFIVFHLIPKIAKQLDVHIYYNHLKEDRNIIDFVWEEYYAKSIVNTKPKLRRTK